VIGHWHDEQQQCEDAEDYEGAKLDTTQIYGYNSYKILYGYNILILYYVLVTQVWRQ